MFIFALWAGACSVMALVKLIGFVRAIGIRFNIAQICLAIELVANLCAYLHSAGFCEFKLTKLDFGCV